MNNTRMRTFCFVMLLLSVLNSNAQQSIFSYDNKQPLHEIRAVWLTTYLGLDWPRTKATDSRSIEKQKNELREILDNLQYVHINTVLFQTRLRGTVLYPSKYEPWDECLTGKPGIDPGYDPLKFCIDECHARGMECHAWVVSIPVDKEGRQKQYGEGSVTMRRPDLCKKAGGDYFMMPGNPATADYIAGICREIAEKYDVDGISLDYIRYPEKTYNFSDNEFYDKQKTGKSVAEWKRDNITRIVRKVHDRVKAVKPWVKLSCSPVGKYRSLTGHDASGWNCLDAVYQDPVKWLKEGIQDILFPMMYFKNGNFFPFMYDWAQNCGGRLVCPGLGVYFLDPKEGNWEINDVRAEFFESRRARLGGQAIFRSDFLTRDVAGLYDCCHDELYMYPALTPRMIWQQDTIAPSKPTDLRFTAERIHWEKSTDYAPSTMAVPSSPHNYVTYNVYGSRTYPVDTKNSENLICGRVMSTSLVIENLTATKKYFAVTAVDRYGNESEPVQGVYEGGDLTRNLDVKRLINNTYITAIPVMPEPNYHDFENSSDDIFDFTEIKFGEFDMDNAIMSQQTKADKYKSRERIVLVPVSQKDKDTYEKPKKMSITAKNNLRKKLKREMKERMQAEKAKNE